MLALPRLSTAAACSADSSTCAGIPSAVVGGFPGGGATSHDSSKKKRARASLNDTIHIK
jgi:hypothetical protein